MMNMKKSVYLLMLLVFIKSVLAFDLHGFFTSNTETVDFILFTMIFVSVIKLVLKKKFGEDKTGNILYFTLGVVLAAASVFYGNLSIYNIGIWIYEMNTYIMVGFLVLLWFLIYRALPIRNAIVKFIIASFVVIFLAEKVFPGVFSQFLDSGLVNLIFFWGLIIVVLIVNM